jgi:hypothetical protein
MNRRGEAFSDIIDRLNLETENASPLHNIGIEFPNEGGRASGRLLTKPVTGFLL